MTQRAMLATFQLLSAYLKYRLAWVTWVGESDSLSKGYYA